ncbi:cytochrome P450 [Mycena crocata]|nr:cytochrome P450 [Mycena crocata]
MDSIPPSLVAISVAAVCFLLLRSAFGRRNHSFPPGPPSKGPFIGNILHLPREAPWYTLKKWEKEYGDLVYLHGFGMGMLIVNSLDSVNELFGKRGAIYSHRTTFTALGELMGFDKSIVLLPYGEEHKKHKLLFLSSLSNRAVTKFQPAQQDLSAILQKMILDDPLNFMAHIRLTSSHIVLYVAYGMFITETHDSYVETVEATMTKVEAAMQPGTYMCDFMPWLKYSPSWVPFQRRIAETKKLIDATVYKPYDDVRKLVEKGMAPPSLARDIITGGTDSADHPHRGPWVTGSLYGGGTETVAGSVQTFTLAMTMYPEIQKRAQKELEDVCGDRMPVIADMPRLPFIHAIIQEVLRWHPPVPLSVPRRTAKDDVYKGFFIPKNTAVMPNLWGISREVDDPYTFNPDRFLVENPPPDPFDYVFGLGRRICVGNHIAEASIFAMSTAILYAFNLAPRPGEKLEAKFNGHLITYAKPYNNVITPRSEKKAQWIRENSARIIAERGKYSEERD